MIFKKQIATTQRKKKALYDPDQEGAFVLFRPSAKQEATHTAIVLDPRLKRYLRPHQMDGVKFLFDSINSNNAGVCGCILADEM